MRPATRGLLLFPTVCATPVPPDWPDLRGKQLPQDRDFSWLRRSGEEYTAAFNRYTDKRFKWDLEGRVAPTRSQAVLEQDLLSRRKEEANTVKQAEAQLKDLRVLEDVDKRVPLPPALAWHQGGGKRDPV